MIAEELINQMVPPLKASDEAGKALEWMEEFRCNHLPVVNENTLLGFVSEGIILDANNYTKKVGELELIGRTCFVLSQAHFLDILKVAGNHHLHSVAVVDDGQKYVGLITLLDIMTSFAQSASVQMNGSILVLSMELVDYSLAEICRYIEENDAKVISSTIIQDPLDPAKIKLSLKINQSDISRIVATLERFNYRIIGRYQEAQLESSDKERLGLLFKYLNI